MNPKIVLIAPALYLAALLFSGCSRKLVSEGSFQSTKITADGNPADWERPLRFGNKQATIQYSITNDNDNIYVCVLSNDDATQLKMLRQGMNLYFDPLGGDSKKTGIAFPLSKPFMPAQSTGTAEQQPIAGQQDNAAKRKQELILQSTLFTASGFQNMENRSYDVSDKSQLQVALKLNSDNSLVYEAIIPIEHVLGHRMSNTEGSKNFSVGIVVNGMKAAGANYGNGGSGGGRSAMGGMGGRGGMGRGMGGGRGGMGGGRQGGMNSYQQADRTAMFKEDANWNKFALVYKK